MPPKSTQLISERKDKELWQAFKRGDQQAFEQIYRSFFPVLANYGSRLTADTQRLEDAIQDLFVDLWRRSAHLGEVENIKFYLFRSLRNQLLRNSRHDVFEQSEAIDDFLDYLVALSAEEQTVEQEGLTGRTEQVRQAVSKLSPRQQEAINLRFYHGMSLDQTAQLMGVSKQAISNLLFKAYILLRMTMKSLATVLLIFLK